MAAGLSASTRGGRPYEAAVKRQSVVRGLTAPLRTVVRPVRVNAPQVPDTSSAELVVALQRDGLPGELVAQRAAHRRAF